MTNFYQFVKVTDYGNGQTVIDANAIQNSLLGHGVTIEAGKPYLVFTQNGKLLINNSTCWHNGGIYEKITLNTSSGNLVSIIPSDSTNAYESKWEFRGTFQNIEWDANHQDLGRVYGFKVDEGDFVKAKAGANIPAMRAYLYYNRIPVLAKHTAVSSVNDIADEVLPEKVSIRFIDKDGETLSIGTMNTITGEITMDENKWFDMKGRVLNKKPTVKGTYYNKGQKVIIK